VRMGGELKFRPASKRPAPPPPPASLTAAAMRAMSLAAAALLALVGLRCADAQQMRGVNLGGWFVLESWLYPGWWRNVTGGAVPDGQGE
jgi:hypothetical protein